MTAALSIAPTSPPVRTTPTVTATGGGAYKNRLLLNGVAVFGDCSDTGFTAGVTMPSTVGSQSLEWDQLIAGVWTSVATLTFSTVAASSTSVFVTSIAQMKGYMLDDSIDTIIVADGTYSFTPGSGLGFSATSLWFAGNLSGGAYNTANRMNPITIKAETRGGVTFDGGGGSGAGLTFLEGVHHQTWDGFHLANFVPASNGAVTFGGFDPTGRIAPHHITLQYITLDASVHRSSSGSTQDQGFYFAHAQGTGPHDLTLDHCTIVGTDALCVWGGIHSFHGDATFGPSSNVTITNLTITGTTYPIILWCDTAGSHPHDWLISGAAISGAGAHAMRYENVDATAMQFTSIVSTGSPAGAGFDSSLCSPRTDYTDLSAQATFTTCAFG